jgi:two-component system cell cycle response regulator
MRKQKRNLLAMALGCVSAALIFVGSAPTYAEQLAPIYLLLGIVGMVLAFLSLSAGGGLPSASHDPAQIDPLTQLANRRALDHAFSAGQGGLLLMVDLDDFKRINDAHGHLEGDRVLRDAAQQLRRTTPQTGLTCRYGGEEFAIVLPASEPSAGLAVAEQIRTSFAAKQIGAAKGNPLTVSIGGAARQPAEATRALIGRADAALYAAKRAGRNQTFFHDGRRPRAVDQDG